MLALSPPLVPACSFTAAHRVIHLHIQDTLTPTAHTRTHTRTINTNTFLPFPRRRQAGGFKGIYNGLSAAAAGSAPGGTSLPARKEGRNYL